MRRGRKLLLVDPTQKKMKLAMHILRTERGGLVKNLCPWVCSYPTAMHFDAKNTI